MNTKLKQPKLQANKTVEETDVFSLEPNNENDIENEENGYHLLFSDEHDE